jgi:hypothetical protein
MLGSASRRHFAESTVAAIVQLPHLHTLAVERCAEDASVWSALADCPALTSLSVVDAPAAEMGSLELEGDRFAHSCLQYVRECWCQPTHLSLSSFALQGDGFQSFFTGSYMPWLQSLHLTGLQCLDVPSAGFLAAFGALISLESLRATRCSHLNLLLYDVPFLSSLRRLTLDISDELARDEGNAPYPEVIASALRRTSQLQCTMVAHVPSDEERRQHRRDETELEPADDESHYERQALFLELQQRYEQSDELRPFKQRFRVIRRNE